MTLATSNLKNIFENIDNGCVLAFYNKKWYLQLIPFFTREVKKELTPQHCGIAYEVVRYGNICKFNLSEQNFHGGKYREIKIYKHEKLYYIFDDYFLKQSKIKMFQVKMTDKQIELGIADAKKQLGKKYGYLQLFFGWEFLEKILPKSFFEWLNKKELSRVCSTHIAKNLKYAGVSVPNNDFLTPLEITKLKIYV